MKESKITLTDLRTILYGVENQDMTVRELRYLIFKAQETDNPFDAYDLQGFVRNITKE